FLPVPKQGLAQFNPVLFNYQSTKEHPAVLAIVATREGTSVTVIDNHRDAFATPGGAWGQRLFFNQNGQRASLTGQRLSDFQAGSTPSPNDPAPEAAGQKGLNMVLLIQVPLKLPPPPPKRERSWSVAAPMAEMAPGAGARAKSDVEEA